MKKEQKPDIRIIAERVSVTTIRTTAILYCELCRRELNADEIQLAALASQSHAAVQKAPETSNARDDKKGETK